MGSYIGYLAQKQNEEDEWETVLGKDNFACPQDYDLFGWLGFEERNYAKIPPLPTVHKGFPKDFERDRYEFFDTGGHSWVFIKDLVEFNYDAIIENKRDLPIPAPLVKNADGVYEPVKGEMTTCREMFSASWFDDLKKMQEYEATRLLFWFH